MNHPTDIKAISRSFAEWLGERAATRPATTRGLLWTFLERGEALIVLSDVARAEWGQTRDASTAVVPDDTDNVHDLADRVMWIINRALIEIDGRDDADTLIDAYRTDDVMWIFDRTGFVGAERRALPEVPDTLPDWMGNSGS